MGIALPIAALSVLVSMALLIFRDDVANVITPGASSYSSSAVGHQALMRLLEELEIPVEASRRSSVLRARATERPLLMLEPDVDEPLSLLGELDMDMTPIEDMLYEAPELLLVLPKRRATMDAENPRHAGTVELLSVHSVSEIATFVHPSLDVFRTQLNVDWEIAPDAPVSVTPTVNESLQLLTGDDLTPLVSCRDGVLLARVSRYDRPDLPDVWILSDPDVLNVQGLDDGNNDQFSVELIQAVQGDADGLIVDETLHGLAIERSAIREMFNPPVLYVTLHSLLLILLLIWAGYRRFGSPLEQEPEGRTGTEILLQHTTNLLIFAGYTHHALEEYLKDQVRTVGRDLHLPEGLAGEELCVSLDRMKRSDIEIRDTWNTITNDRTRKNDTRSVIASARRIHRWRQEMLNVTQ